MTDFLYPFIESDERDPTSLLDDLARSVEAKAGESTRLAATVLEDTRSRIRQVGAQMAERFSAGGRLLAFGNGGSSTDAAALVALFSPDFPARNLVSDSSILTALGNDVGFDLVFSRQVIAYGSPGDIAVGFSTSGNSANLLAAFEEAHRRGLLTIGLAGYDGGSMALSAAVDHCFVVPSQSVHRIQEAQAALSLALRRAVA